MKPDAVENRDRINIIKILCIASARNVLQCNSI